MAFLNLAGVTHLKEKLQAWADNKFALKTSLPTKVSQLTNDSGYQTSSQVDTKINAKVSSIYRYKATVASYGDLPTSGQTVGDTYNITAADASKGIKAGDNVAWIGGGGGENKDGWDILSGMVDLSNYVTKVSGKGLSTNDYTTAEKNKLAGLSNAVAMKGATASAAGAAGLVPAPAAGAQAKYLRGDGTWGSPTFTVPAEYVTETELEGKGYLTGDDLQAITNEEIDKLFT